MIQSGDRRRTVFALAVCCVATSTQPSIAVDLIGYVPWYRMDSSYNTGTLPAQLAMLDEVRYFGLTAASNGSVTPLGGGSGDMNAHLNRIATIKSAIEALSISDRPRLNITLGGAGEAATFAAIAPNSGLRTTFALSIDSLLDQTGATSVDIDWEHPAAGPERTTHYPAMLKRIKQELGADRRVYATVDPTVMISNSVFSGPDAIDGVSLMTYDLGWWGNDPSNPYQGEHSLPEYAADATEAWTEPAGSPNDRPWVFGTWGNNAPEEKLGIGLPFYAHTVTNPDATYTFSQLVSGGTTTDGNYYTYAGRSVWLPGPILAAERVEYAFEQGLQHVIIWELGQDVHPDYTNSNPHKTSILRSAFEAKLALHSAQGDFDGDGNSDENDYNLWSSTFSSPGAPRADGNFDDAVDAADYVVWRKFAASSGGSANIPVPEPQAACALTFVTLLSFARHKRTA